MRIPFFTTRKALFLILTLQLMLVSAELGLSGQNHADSQPATDSYFPRGIFAASQIQRSDLIAEWFAGYLRKMNETPLFKSIPDADEFRLTRISPLGTEIIVRLNIVNNGTSKLTVKVASGDGEMLINRTGDVTSEQVERFLHLVNDSGFWRLPSSELEEGQQVTDGEFWLLEGTTHDNYHAVFRSNPKPSTYTELGRYLAEHLGKLDNSIFNTPEYTRKQSCCAVKWVIMAWPVWRMKGARCDPSRGCTRGSAADGRSVTETTMRTVEVVMLEPGSELVVAFERIVVVANVGPLAQGSLNKAFCFAIGAGSVGAGEAVLDAELEAGGAKLAGAIAASVVGEEAADGDAMLGIESDGIAEEDDGGFGLLVGQHAREGEAGMIVDGDVQSLPVGELRAAAAAAIAANGDLLIAGHALDVEVEQIAGSGMFIADDGRSGMQMTPAVEMGALQDAADGGGAEMGS